MWYYGFREVTLSSTMTPMKTVQAILPQFGLNFTYNIMLMQVNFRTAKVLAFIDWRSAGLHWIPSATIKQKQYPTHPWKLPPNYSF